MIPEETTTLLRHKGAINGPIISEILDDLDFKCINFDIPDSKRKKIFNIAVEMFQNLYHYTRDLIVEGYDIDELREIDLSLVVDIDYYILATKNLIKNEDIEVLKSKINHVNTLEEKELKAYYKQVLSNEKFSEKGGAGLGFIDMKKRSGLPLEITFEKINEKTSYYRLLIRIEKKLNK